MRNTQKIKKACAVNTGSANSLNHAGGIDNDSRVYNRTGLTKNQRLCLCGAIIPRDEVLLEKAKLCSNCRQQEIELKSEVLAVVITPRRIVKCVPCKNCKKSFALSKLSNLLICRDCLISARTQTPAKQKRMIAGIVAKFEASLRRQISFGGANANV